MTDQDSSSDNLLFYIAVTLIVIGLAATTTARLMKADLAAEPPRAAVAVDHPTSDEPRSTTASAAQRESTPSTSGSGSNDAPTDRCRNLTDPAKVCDTIRENNDQPSYTQCGSEKWRRSPPKGWEALAVYQSVYGVLCQSDNDVLPKALSDRLNVLATQTVGVRLPVDATNAPPGVPPGPGLAPEPEVTHPALVAPKGKPKKPTSETHDVPTAGPTGKDKPLVDHSGIGSQSAKPPTIPSATTARPADDKGGSKPVGQATAPPKETAPPSDEKDGSK